MFQETKNIFLLWVSVATLSVGIAIYILLKPANYDVEIQRFRLVALVAATVISGICIIISTSKRWFGKNL